jgi:glycosyltransferase involved in cell wall biosynthesis
MLRALRSWDLDSAQRVDYFIANSRNVARRIRKHYRRAAVVIYPPVNTSRFTAVAPHEVGTHFLVVSRLLPYKRIDLAIEACNRLGVPLRVVGSGPDKARLQRMAGPTIRFLGHLTDIQVAAEYARCRALIFPGEEDFGMTPVESMASGRPVVAYGVGGALETIIDGTTGLFFYQPTPEALAASLTAVDRLSIVPEVLRLQAERFDACMFQERMRRFVAAAMETHEEDYGSRLACERPTDTDQPLNELPISEMLPGFGFSK